MLKLERRDDACGLPILASKAVSAAAIDAAKIRLERLLRNESIVNNLRECNVQLEVIAPSEKVTQLPQYFHLHGTPRGDAMEAHGRAYGGLAPCVNEDNLLALASDRFSDHRDVCTHEFAHSVLSYGACAATYSRVEQAYNRAIAAGKWTNMYAATNADEYFAEAAMWFAGSRGDYGTSPPQGIRPGPEWLQEYDPEIYSILHQLFDEKQLQDPVEIVPLRVKTLSRLSFVHVEIKTEYDGPKCQLIVVNESPNRWHVSWFSKEGKKNEYFSIEPQQRIGQETFQGHVWHFESETGLIYYGNATSRISKIVLK